MTHSGDTLDAVVGPGARVGEGARWDRRERVVWWVDIPAGRIHRYDPGTGADELIEIGQRVGSVALRRGGGVVACTEDGVASVDWTNGVVDPLVSLCADDPDVRCNDAAVDPEGRLWVGTMSMSFRPAAGALHRVEATASGIRAERVLDGLELPNGMAWSPDGSTMYLIETFKGVIWAIPFDAGAGTLGERRLLVEVDRGDGMPDGMAVDAGGQLWVAWFRGAAVRVYAPDGRLVDTVAVPTWQVTSVAFGGDDLDEIYVTSASEHLTDEQRAEHALAGALFHGRRRGAGLPAGEFTG